MANWFYPNIVLKTAPKDLNCSDCGINIPKFGKYYRHNYGRYYNKCSNNYDSKYKKVEVD